MAPRTAVERRAAEIGAAARRERTPSAIVARNLRRRREELGWSQEDLASGMRTSGFGGFTRATVAQIETGRRRLGVDELVVLAFLLQTPIAPKPPEVYPPPATWGVDEPLALLSVPPNATISVGTANWGAQLVWVPGHWIVDPGAALTGMREAEAVEKIALDLGVGLADVSEAATRLWGHGIITERERRLTNGDGGMGDARLRRSHITRTLIGELQRAVAGGFAARAKEAERRLAEIEAKGKRSGATRRSGR